MLRSPLLVSLSLIIVLVSAQCYWLDGSVAPDYSPCSATGVSMCSYNPHADKCQPNGLILGTNGEYFRNACSDPTWPSPGCVALCPGNATYAGLAHCGDGSFCCGYTNTACCDRKEGTFLAANFASIITPTTSTQPPAVQAPVTQVQQQQAAAEPATTTTTAQASTTQAPQKVSTSTTDIPHSTTENLHSPAISTTPTPSVTNPIKSNSISSSSSLTTSSTLLSGSSTTASSRSPAATDNNLASNSNSDDNKTTTTTTTTTPPSQKSHTLEIALGVSLGVAVLLALGVALGCLARQWLKKKKKFNNSVELPGSPSGKYGICDNPPSREQSNSQIAPPGMAEIYTGSNRGKSTAAELHGRSSIVV